MEDLVSEIESSHRQVKKEQGRLLNKLDDLIADAQKTQTNVEQSLGEQRACNSHLVSCVKRSQDSFKKVVNVNKNYYDVLSKQSKGLGTAFSTRIDAFRTKELQTKNKDRPQSLPEDLNSLFFPQMGDFDKDVVNELISEHMVLDDPASLQDVIKQFQKETGCHIGTNLIEMQRNLRRIVPAIHTSERAQSLRTNPAQAAESNLINIELALEWLTKQDNNKSKDLGQRQAQRGQQTVKKPAVVGYATQDELVFRLHKAKCVQLLSKAV